MPAMGAWVSTALLLGATCAAVLVNERRPPHELVRPLDAIPGRLAGWELTAETPLGEAVRDELRPSAYLSRTYRRQALQLGLFVAYYGAQRAGENMHSPKHCLPGSGWDIVRRTTETIRSAGRDVPINRLSIRKPGQNMTVLYWYQSRGRVVADEYLDKVLLVRDAILEGGSEGTIVRIALAEGAALEPGRQFAAALIPELQLCLGPRD